MNEYYFEKFIEALIYADETEEEVQKVLGLAIEFDSPILLLSTNFSNIIFSMFFEEWAIDMIYDYVEKFRKNGVPVELQDGYKYKITVEDHTGLYEYLENNGGFKINKDDDRSNREIE